MRPEEYPRCLIIARLLVGVLILFVILPEVASPLEQGILSLEFHRANPCQDHHCPMDTSQPIHHCPLCCNFSHHFTNEAAQGFCLTLSDSFSSVAAVSQNVLNNLLPESIFHPPESHAW